MSDPSLHDLFAGATDRVNPPGLADLAWRTARQRRARRAAASGVGAASAVLAVVLAVTQVGGERAAEPAPSTNGPSPATPSPTPVTPSPSPALRTTDVFDPRTVYDLPSAPDGVAPALPGVIDPPETAPSVTEDPMQAAVAVSEQDGVAFLLGTDGAWREQVLEGEALSVRLSPDGGRLVSAAYLDSGQRATVYDLTTGSSRVLEAPPSFRPFDDASWSWQDDDTLVLRAGTTGWEVDPEAGVWTRLPYPVGGLSTTFDEDGVLLTSADFAAPNTLTDRAGGRARTVSMAATGRLSSIHADADTVVGTSYDGRPFAAVVADRETLTPQAVLPVRDHDANFSNGLLSVLALADDGTVILRVGSPGGTDDGFAVVAWDPAAGSLSLVSRTTSLAQVDFAENLLRRAGSPDGSSS